MKRFFTMIMTAAALFSAVSCESFFDTEDVVSKNTANFPANEEDMVLALNSVYSGLALKLKGDANWKCTMMFGDFLADSNIPGGGSEDNESRAIAQFMRYGENSLSSMWRRLYRGIHRANYFLDHCDQIEWNKENPEKMMGETYFIRALHYFDLVRTFENVPVVKSADVDPEIPQSSPDETFSFICSDFVRAIDRLPATPFSAMPKSELGRATKWAAEAMLARAYLFYTGVYNQTEIKLDDGSVLDLTRVQGYIVDCIENSGHALISDFRNLWPYSFVNEDYAYAKDNHLSWIGEEGDNTETVFAVKYSAFGKGYVHNPLPQANSMRLQAHIPFGQGNTISAVNPRFFEEWPDEDLRKIGSICDVTDPYEGIKYKWNANGKSGTETGLYNKKYITVNVKGPNGKPMSYSTFLYGASPKFQENLTQDLVLMRFADVLLMGAELQCPNAQQYLDQVRARVQLPSVPATLENIKNERKYELAFEGVRFYDLMRWHDLDEIDRAKANLSVKHRGKDAVLTFKFRPETRGFFMIPEDEVLLSHGTLKQNAGWDTPEANYQR